MCLRPLPATTNLTSDQALLCCTVHDFVHLHAAAALQPAATRLHLQLGEQAGPIKPAAQQQRCIFFKQIQQFAAQSRRCQKHLHLQTKYTPGHTLTALSRTHNTANHQAATPHHSTETCNTCRPRHTEWQNQSLNVCHALSCTETPHSISLKRCQARTAAPAQLLSILKPVPLI